MKSLVAAFLGLLWLTTGCITAAGEETVDSDEPAATTEDDDAATDDDQGGDQSGADSTSNIADNTGDDDAADDDDSDDDDSDDDTIQTTESDFVGTEQLTADAPAPGAVECPGGAPAWAPNNNGAAAAPVSQADLVLDCKQMGAGLLPGFVRYGCNAMKRDGSGHYGIVLGWWRINRQDGVRAHAKHLNFREGGFDMTFDLPLADSAGGIVLSPAQGEVPAPTTLSSR